MKIYRTCVSIYNRDPIIFDTFNEKNVDIIVESLKNTNKVIAVSKINMK